MRHQKPRCAALLGPLSAARRRFLGYGSAVIAASVTGPLFSRLAQAQTASFDFYISPTGSDSNPGTSASPWALTALNTHQAAYAGHRVGVLPGTYNCLSLIGGSYGSSFSTPAFNIAGGTAGSPTVIQSTVPQGAILDGGANASNNPNGQPLIGTISPACGLGYITLDGFEVRNTYARAISVGYDPGAATPSQRLLGIVVQNCYVHALTNTIQAGNPTGITAYACNGALIQNNYITNLADTSSRASGIQIWTSINCVTQFNTIVSTSSQQVDGINHKNMAQSNNTICYNYIDLSASGSNSVNGICPDSDGDGSTTSSVHNNIVIADSSAAPAMIDTGNFPSSLNKQVWYNNTFVGVPNNSVGAFVRFGAPSTISFYNNIISRTSTGGRGDVNTSASALALIDYNCYPSAPMLGLTPNGSTGYPSSLLSSLVAWALALLTTSGKDAHSITGNPQFAASGSGPAYYQLQSGSPCKGSGSTNGGSGGSPTDMGAWGNGATTIGCSFAPGATAVVVPNPPQIISVT